MRQAINCCIGDLKDESERILLLQGCLLKQKINVLKKVCNRTNRMIG